MTLTARPTPAGRAGRDDHGISAPFGRSPQYFNGTRDHHGQDYYWLLADPAGSRKVFAAGAGVVSKIAFDATMGNCITVDHVGFQTRYCHMPKGSAMVKPGQTVTDKTQLGPMGNAGTAANGQFHLHFEVWVNGQRVDPEPFFRTLKPTERQVLTTASANKRLAASRSGELRGTFPAGSIVNFDGFERGEPVEGIDAWGVVGEFYSWLGGFTDPGTHDLPDLTPPPPPDPEPMPEPPPDEPTPEDPPNPPETPPDTTLPDPRPVHPIFYLIVLAGIVMGSFTMWMIGGGWQQLFGGAK